jgi:nucleotide-binding universal stress UspA family protein
MRDRPLVVGVDGSAESARALDEAVGMATANPDRGGLDLVVVFVRQASWASMSIDAGAVVNDALDEIEQDVRRIAGDALRHSDLSWRLEVRRGEPAHELVKAANEFGAQTIVVGGHRHSAIASAVTQSVNSELVHIHPGSLVIVRPPSAALASERPSDAVSLAAS